MSIVGSIIAVLSANPSNYYMIIPLGQMKDGLKDIQLRKYYANDIRDVYEMSDSDIEIRYADVDLNDDGYKDKIVTVRSGLHSGSGGDTFDILINDKYDGYTAASSIVFQMDDAIVYILMENTNGFHDIVFKNYQGSALLIYENGGYYLEKPIVPPS